MAIVMEVIRAKFAPGQRLETAGARTMLSRQEREQAFARHLTGDWGEVDAEDWERNEQALAHNERLLSRYTTNCGVVHWVITEADRSVTTILLPEEY
jgi:hypothetical protein